MSVLQEGNVPMLKMLLASAALVVAMPASAAWVYVGSWTPYMAEAPYWDDPAFYPNGPLAYTGQEAAALLFGGNAGDYAISTVSADVADINFSAWYDVIGLGGDIFAQDYSQKYLGLYYGPQLDWVNGGAASAFIRDNFVNETNYAFRWDGGVVPEPATWAMMIAGFGLVGSALRRRNAATA